MIVTVATAAEAAAIELVFRSASPSPIGIISAPRRHATVRPIAHQGA